MSLLVLCCAEVEPLGEALLDATELFPLSLLSLLQVGHESSQLPFPVVSKLHDGIQVLCVLQQDGHCHSQSAIELPEMVTKPHVWVLVFLTGILRNRKCIATFEVR